MKLYRTNRGPAVEADGNYVLLEEQEWDDLIVADDLPRLLAGALRSGLAQPGTLPESLTLLAPISHQEVWAAGVTYLRSKQARMDESESAGGGDFYDRVYAAPRPELFFKATPHRVSAPGQPVRIRSDSKWNVPEPELTLLINPRGQIIGYTIGNDMSSRDIEGENPLYLPQAKVYDGCCALGPCVLISNEPPARTTEIALEIRRGGKTAFGGNTSLANLKRELKELVEYLYRDNSFPTGCFLLTGTGLVPPDSFTLQSGDEIRITIEPIGVLVNPVA
jgi:2-dehydro-3-deoxy-D-arabinonate dehydratase